MAPIKVPDDGSIDLPEGEFVICTGCRRPIDPNDPTTIRAHSTADCERAAREPGHPIEMHVFHPSHYPGGKLWRLAGKSATESYVPVQRVVLPLAVHFQLVSLLAEQDAPGADLRAVKAKTMAWGRRGESDGGRAFGVHHAARRAQGAARQRRPRRHHCWDRRCQWRLGAQVIRRSDLLAVTGLIGHPRTSDV